MPPVSVCFILLLTVDAAGAAAGAGAAPNAAGAGGHARDSAATFPTTTPAAHAAVASVPEMIARIDSLHPRRDDRAALAEERRLVDAAVTRGPGDYGVLWRAARLYFWLSDDPSLSSDERSKLGKTGWDLAERAIAVNPGDGAGYYYAAVNMGNYALGLGVMKALTMGMEGKFKSRLERAGQLAPRYEHGGVDVAWGRFYEKLPWPKRDRKKAEQHLRRVLTDVDGNNLRARVYLADTLAQDDRPAEAKKLLDEVIAAPGGRYDAAEERRAKALATGLLPGVLKQLH